MQLNMLLFLALVGLVGASEFRPHLFPSMNANYNLSCYVDHVVKSTTTLSDRLTNCDHGYVCVNLGNNLTFFYREVDCRNTYHFYYQQRWCLPYFVFTNSTCQDRNTTDCTRYLFQCDHTLLQLTPLSMLLLTVPAVLALMVVTIFVVDQYKNYKKNGEFNLLDRVTSW